MVGLLKTFAKGLLYVIGLPFFLVALAIFGIVGLLAFIFQIIKSIIFFFTGQKFFPELPEDKELRLLKEGPKEESTPIEPDATQNKEESSNIFTFIKDEPQEAPIIEHHEPVYEEKKPTPTIEEACFEKPIESKEEIVEETNDYDDPLGNLLNDDQEEEEVIEETPIEEAPVETPTKEVILETSSKVEKDEDLMEELETYVPRSSNYSASDDDDDDNDTGDSGVNINYDL